MISLGCPKTLVDSEVILGKLDPQKYEIIPTMNGADIALLNTCSFIQDAQKESVDRILELIQMKKEKRIRGLVVMGCLVQEFPKELKKELREVDAFVGSGEYHKISTIMESVTQGEKVFTVGTPGYLATSAENRMTLTPRHYRYLKISEGCDHICSFCTIPSFRGKHRSRTLEDVVQEAGQLVSKGAKEIILTGQDTSYFGRDYGSDSLLPSLIRRMNEVPGIEWCRVLYAYPSCITQELMEAMGESEHACKYLDMPLQHASDRMLLSMRRGMTQRRTVDLIEQFRKTVPNLAIRTTFIVGFPGETDKDFNELLEFIRNMRFERLGIFKFSKEQGSAAALLPDQVPEKLKAERLERAMLVQQQISKENNELLIGCELKVLIDRKSQEKGFWVSRSERDAPEVDSNVLIRSDEKLEIGTFYHVRITEGREYDLVGEL